MPRLCAFGCQPTGVAMHCFPSHEKFPERFKAWVTLCGGKLETEFDYEHYKKKKVCDWHFTDKDRNRNKRLNALAVPSLCLSGITLHSFPNPTKYLDRYNAWVKIVAENIESVDYEKYIKRRICDIHFSEAFKLRNNRISVDAIPTLYLNGLSTNETPEAQHKTGHLSTLETKHSETVETLLNLSPTQGSSLLDSIDEVIPQLSSHESSQLVLVKAGSAQLSIPERTHSDEAKETPTLAAAESNFGLIDESPPNSTLGTSHSDAKEMPIRLSSLKSTTDLVKPIPTFKEVQCVTEAKQTKKCMPVSTIFKTVPENEQDMHVKLVRIRKKLLHYKTILNKQALELREARKWMLHPEVKQLVESLKTKSLSSKR